MSNCSRRRIKNPNGTWNMEALIGGKVRIRSTAVTNFFGTFLASEECTIKDIYFQISLDGKAITLIEVAEYPGKFFTWKDLEVIEVGEGQMVNATCGLFTAGESQAGRNVDKEPTWLEDLNGGIAIVDKDGNVIINRYIRLTNAKAEDLEGEQVTEITFCGDIIG